MRVRTLFVGALTLLGVLVMAMTVAAHAKLVRAEPKPGSTVATPPTTVHTWFNDELDVKRSALRVTDRAGSRVDRGDGRVDLDDLDRKSMLAGVKPLGAGTYTVQWTAVSADDGFVARGSYRFTVAAAHNMPTGPAPANALPPLSLVSPADGATVTNPLKIVVETPVDLAMMTMGADHGSGPRHHLHIDIDKRVNMPTAKHLTKVGEKRYEFNAGTVPAGKRVIRVYWGDKNHKVIGTVRTITVTVK